tara:strand:- start:791 stop:985 length:195 start_codon:yes stop_codon:yes gene_type:complete
MSNKKEINELVSKITDRVLEDIYTTVDHEMEYSDIDFEPDGSECVRDYEEYHDYIMNQVINNLK